MNPGLFLLLIGFTISGPIADWHWYANTGEADPASVQPEPSVTAISGLYGRSWIEKGRRRTSFNATAGGSVGRSGYRIEMRIERREDRNSPGVSTAFVFNRGLWRLSYGPSRGGLGGGLLVGWRVWNTSGADVRGAWIGIPTGLRVGPVSNEYLGSKALVWQTGGSLPVVLALLYKRELDPCLVLELRPSRAIRTVLLKSREQYGAEVTVGGREGGVRWRISAAVWNSVDTVGGSSLEAVVSGRKRVASWELRLWSWYGTGSSFAPPPGRATDDRPIGGRLAVELQPVKRLRLAAALESAIDGDRGSDSEWWRSQLLVTVGSSSGLDIRLRLRKTGEVNPKPWIERNPDERCLTEIKIRSGPAGRVRFSCGLRRQDESSSGLSRGIWLQMELTDQRWKGYLRGTLSLPASRNPLYWFEPGPVFGWNMNIESTRRIRLLVGILNGGGTWHMQLKVDSNGSVGFKGSFRFLK